jgi:hypothetical protein
MRRSACELLTMTVDLYLMHCESLAELLIWSGGSAD